MPSNQVPCKKEFRDLEKAKRKSELGWTKVDLAEIGLDTGGFLAAIKCSQVPENPAGAESCVTAALAYLSGLAVFSTLLEDANDADLDAADAANRMLDCANDHKEFFGDTFDGIENF